MVSRAGQTERHRDYMLRKYQSVHDWDTLCKMQSDKCMVCKKETHLVIDHDHNTGKVRGLICRQCNVGIGMFKDDVTLLMNAIDYLSNTRKRFRPMRAPPVRERRWVTKKSKEEKRSWVVDLCYMKKRTIRTFDTEEKARDYAARFVNIGADRWQAAMIGRSRGGALPCSVS